MATTDIAGRLDRALQSAGIPIAGVTIGSLTDRATWVIQYKPTATAQHRIDGEALRLSFDPDSAAAVSADLDLQAQSANNQSIVKAVLAELLEVKLGRQLTPADIPALQLMFQRTVVYYKFIVNNGL